MSLIVMYFQIRDFIVPHNPGPPIPAPIVQPTSAAGYGGSGSVNYSGEQAPELHQEPLQVAVLQSPYPGETIKNPVHFEWDAAPDTYYLIEIHDTEPGNEFVYRSQWVSGNAVDINLPDQAIGNLEWCIYAIIDLDDGVPAQSDWRHFTFDPFKDNKERQNDE